MKVTIEISGKQGEGKTTLANLLGKYISRIKVTKRLPFARDAKKHNMFTVTLKDDEQDREICHGVEDHTVVIKTKQVRK